MDIRTKLVFSLVAVALGTMAALGAFMYSVTNQQLMESKQEQLEGLATSIQDGMKEIAAGWEDRVGLIANRTELREILLANNLEGSPQAKLRISRILDDASAPRLRAAPRSVEALAVYDAEGQFVGSARWGTEEDLSVELSSMVGPEDGVVYQGVKPPDGDRFRVAYSAALTSDGTERGELVGELQARLNAGPLARLTRNREGLGPSGETLIVLRDNAGEVIVLKGGGNGTMPQWDVVELGGDSDPVARAVSGQEGFYSEGMFDSDGNEVWAAVRYLEETQWGLVVKVDKEEATRAVREFFERLTDVIISLAAFAILVGTFLGLRFAKPIHELASTASRIRDGDLSVRAPVTTQDEVGHLARNFNQMADELEQQVSLLREFQNYFDLSRDMLCIAGTDGYFKRVNPAFEKILGWTVDELLSQKFLDFVHPDDLPKTEKEIQRLAQGLPTISFENRYMCQDGSEKILAWTAHPEPETGLIYAIARDVTDLKRERDQAASEIADLSERLEAAEADRRS
jgi:PAS domain S-box-containing protein